MQPAIRRLREAEAARHVDDVRVGRVECERADAGAASPIAGAERIGREGPRLPAVGALRHASKAGHHEVIGIGRIDRQEGAGKKADVGQASGQGNRGPMVRSVVAPGDAGGGVLEATHEVHGIGVSGVDDQLGGAESGRQPDIRDEPMSATVSSAHQVAARGAVGRRIDGRGMQGIDGQRDDADRGRGRAVDERPAATTVGAAVDAAQSRAQERVRTRAGVHGHRVRGIDRHGRHARLPHRSRAGRPGLAPVGRSEEGTGQRRWTPGTRRRGEGRGDGETGDPRVAARLGRDSRLVLVSFPAEIGRVLDRAGGVELGDERILASAAVRGLRRGLDREGCCGIAPAGRHADHVHPSG